MKSSAVSRIYRSELRTQQAAETRARILGQVAELLAAGSLEELSHAEVARRSRVSLRTVYRYFPTREALVEALNDWILAKMRLDRRALSAEELPEMVRGLFRSFGENEILIRASVQTRAGQEVRAGRKRGQVRALGETLTPVTARLPADRARAVHGVFHALISADTWLTLKDHWKSSDADAGAAVGWAIETLLRALAITPRQNKGG